jgi:hypothetical protein
MGMGMSTGSISHRCLDADRASRGFAGIGLPFHEQYVHEFEKSLWNAASRLSAPILFASFFEKSNPMRIYAKGRTLDVIRSSADIPLKKLKRSEDA